MGPINAVKELGSVFGGLLKPLKLLKPLFTGLIGGLKKFALGLKAVYRSIFTYDRHCCACRTSIVCIV